MTLETPFVTRVRQEWEQAKRGDWLLSQAIRVPIDDKKLVLAACACLRLVLHLVPRGETRPLTAIQTAEEWARGKAGLEQVRAAYKSAASVSSRAAQAWTVKLDSKDKERAACVYSVTNSATLILAAVLHDVRYVVDAAKGCVDAGTLDNYGHRYEEYELMQLRCADAVRAVIPWADVMPSYLAWYGYSARIKGDAAAEEAEQKERT